MLLTDRLVQPGATVRTRSALESLAGWPVTIAVAGVAAVLRLPALGRPAQLVFDETYYVKDAWTLLNLGYEGRWPDEPDPAFEAGDVDGYLEAPSFVVHPPVGKWVIATGLRLLGAQDPVGWRLGTVVAGIVAVVLLVRIGRRLLGSTAAGALAGLLLALDGTAIALSRTALLDGVLTTFVLAAAAALLVDRDRAAARLAAASAPPRAPARWGAWSRLRPWRVVAGIMLGLAVGTKWSALWFLAVLGLLTVAWDASARHRAGVALWWQGALLRDALPAFVTLVPVAALTYVLTWTGWLRTSGGYGRSWAAQHPGEGVLWLPDGLRSLWRYHEQMWTFHTTLTAEHPYAAQPAGWLLQWRPTSFFYEAPEPAQQVCGADRCAQAVTSLGNPFIWWLGAAAVVACVWWAVRRLDGAAAVAAAGVAAGWVPWFAYTHRTIFTFYAVVVLPWLALAIARAVQRLLAWADDEPRRSMVRTALVAAAVLVVATTAFFWPVWTGQVVTFRYWQLHQWLPSWV
ncbi:dolichyl-phosphate-mannose--protein mannosyltransferase [Actinotalea ferrariae]|uniref:dolichyl-phosphate-mannose--protein mannosyltransferase n=1 Tax=Actinotalea ferrariae TaxID=1386098 RepID=UPI0027DF7121|nr:phospholipid carrier-dependent glycosyltransferase [Actinotalea ferrariae]